MALSSGSNEFRDGTAIYDMCVRYSQTRDVIRPSVSTLSTSGIIIPDSAKKEKPEQGIIIAVGSGKWNEDGDARLAMEVKVGDKVIFSKYGFDLPVRSILFSSFKRPILFHFYKLKAFMSTYLLS